MENFVGYVASGLIGIALGLIGGGGSIITIPVLVYLFHIEPTLATAYSLFIVGTTSLVGGVRGAFHNRVDFKSAFFLAVPSIIGVYFTRHYVLPSIPYTILTVNEFLLTRDTALMLFFALIMVMASVHMIRDKKMDEHNVTTQSHFMAVIFVGLVVGIVTGIVGAGGGFLIIPALVLLVGLPMKRAVGTSLMVIAINSLIGFVGDLEIVKEINFPFLIVLSLLAIGGVFFGTYLSRFIRGKNLKSGFGWFALAMAVFIIVKELMI
jgi:uncharacterized membrane protein YfcA